MFAERDGAMMNTPREGSLVLYKGHPARVQRAGEKLDLLMQDGETARVRLKDVDLLHPGPFAGFGDLQPQAGEVQAAWELLAGSKTTLPELAELVYGAYTPATAWAAWQLVTDGTHFRGSVNDITAVSPAEVAARLAARKAEIAEKQALEAFLERVHHGHTVPGDERYLREVEAVALMRTQRSRVLAALDLEESPESAHTLLLKLGYWDDTVEPHAVRLGVPTSAPALPLPPLPAEERCDLTGLLAFAIDDASTDTPDDALSLEGNRLWIHVADPGALVFPDDDLDREARARGASLYLPEGTVPMLPTAATDLLGLGLSNVSPALSFGVDLDEAGEPVEVAVVPSLVSVRRLTYEEAEQRLDEDPLCRLYRMAQAFAERRRVNGAAMIELPEVDVKVLDGDVVIKPVLPLRSRTLVEEAMVRAGEAVAWYAAKHGIPMPYAAQEATETRLAGDTLSEMYALRRTLRPRRYQGSPAPHAGLGVPAYVQATSPMRRYLDLVAHQQLRAHVLGRSLLTGSAVLERIGEVEAISASLRQAERLADQHWVLVYLRRHPDWRGEGVLVEKHGATGLVLVPDLGLEARVHLPGDLALNSRVTLAVSGVDLPHLDVHFRVCQ